MEAASISEETPNALQRPVMLPLSAMSCRLADIRNSFSSGCCWPIPADHEPPAPENLSNYLAALIDTLAS